MRTAEAAQAKKTRVADQQPKTNPVPRRLSSEEVDRPPQRQRVGTAPPDVPIPPVEAVMEDAPVEASLEAEAGSKAAAPTPQQLPGGAEPSPATPFLEMQRNKLAKFAALKQKAAEQADDDVIEEIADVH
eukprot:3626733-Rhodomonas_salina.1